jgi:hypothetical protein
MMSEEKEYVFALAGGRWFVGEALVSVVNDWYRGNDVSMTLFGAREMFVATQPVVNQETGSRGIRRMSGAVPCAPAEKPTTIAIQPSVVMRGSECPNELESLLKDAMNNETDLTIVSAIPKGGMQ